MNVNKTERTEERMEGVKKKKKKKKEELTNDYWVSLKFQIIYNEL